MSIISLFYLGVLVIGLILFVVYHRIGKLIQCIFFTALTGLGSLGVVWLVGRFVELPVTVTPLSLLVSGVMGIPGVVGMLLLQLI